jgi:glycosyltransferase involved in cell wall biosynthesis
VNRSGIGSSGPSPGAEDDRPKRGESKVDGSRDAEPLVLHVIPTRAARGGQREARALADRLDAPGLRRHRILTLVDSVEGGDEGEKVVADYSIGGGDSVTTVGFDPRLVLRLRRSLDRLDPVLVVAHGGEPLKYLVPALFRRRRPLAYYAIGTLAPPAQHPGRRRMWQFLARRPNLVAAEGSEVFDECRTVLGVAAGRLVLMPNGRDPEEFRPDGGAMARTVPVIVFVGALTEQKRPDRFVDLAAALRARGLEFRALVVGDGPLGSEIKARAEAAGVELLGARGDIADVMKGSDIFVFPSLPRGEGMPGVLIEAGLSALPVVATAVPGVDAIVVDGETGFVVDADDFDGLVGAVASLVDDPERRRTMGEAGRRRCSELFSLDVVASEWRQALLPLLATP